MFYQINILCFGKGFELFFEIYFQLPKGLGGEGWLQNRQGLIQSHEHGGNFLVGKIPSFRGGHQ